MKKLLRARRTFLAALVAAATLSATPLTAAEPFAFLEDFRIRLIQGESPSTTTGDSQAAAPQSQSSDQSALNTPRQSTVRPRRSRRLARVPRMFGDIFTPGSVLEFDAQDLFILDDNAQNQFLNQFPLGIAFVQSQGRIDIPLAGGARRVKIAENNSAIPADRLIYMHNHFRDAIEGDVFQFPLADDDNVTSFPFLAQKKSRRSVSRSTVGFEKTFFDGQASVEVRLPINHRRLEMKSADLESDGGNVGNLAVIVKRILFENDSIIVSGGTGVDVPTGDSAHGRVADVAFQLENDAVHIMPFLMAAGTNNNYFWQAAAQLDVPIGGNEVIVDVDDDPDLFDSFDQDFFRPTSLGDLDEQVLLFISASGGVWIFENPDATILSGIAGVAELHYTKTLEPSREIRAVTGHNDDVFNFRSSNGQLDVVNATFGLHTLFSNGATARFGLAFPLRRGDNRLFDAEAQFQVNVPL